jgi:O-antigen/teichoic acid export membrane protein
MTSLARAPSVHAPSPLATLLGSRTSKAALLAAAQVVAALASLLTMAVLTRALDVDHYATYRQALLVFAFAAPLLALGLPQALFYFLPGEKTRPRAVVTENLLALAALGVPIALFLLAGGHRLLAWRFQNPALAGTLLLLAPFALFALPLSSTQAGLMACDRPGRLAAFTVGQRLLAFAAIAGAAWLWRTANAATAANLLATAVACAAAVSLLFASCPPGDTARPSLRGAWTQMRYSLPLGLSAMLGALTLNVDKLVVSSMTDPRTFAIYSNGAMEAPLVGLIGAAATSVLLPEMSALCKAGRMPEALALWRRVATKCALVMFPLTAFLFAVAGDLIPLLFSATYLASVAPFRVYLLLLPLRIASFSNLFMAANRNRVPLLATVGCLSLDLALSVLLVRWIGSLGAAWASVLVLYGWLLPYYLVAIRRLTAAPFRDVLDLPRLAVIMAAAVACAAPLPFVRPFLPAWPPAALAIQAALYGLATLAALHLSRQLDVPAILLPILRALRPAIPSP